MAFSEASAAPPEKKSLRSRAEVFFFPLMAVLFIATVFVGFARTFFLGPMYNYVLPNLLVSVHGTVFSAWIVLFAVQATLVPAGRTDVHQRLGIAGAYLFGSVVLLGCLIMLEGLRRDVSRPGLDEPGIFSLNLVGLVIAIALIWRGLLLRRDAQAHKRLMLLGTVPLLGPAVIRWPFLIVALHPPIVGLVLDGFTALMICFDLRTRGRIHRATILGGVGIFLAPPLALILSGATFWRTAVNGLQQALWKF